MTSATNTTDRQPTLTGLVGNDYAAYLVFNGSELATGKVPPQALKLAPQGQLRCAHKACLVDVMQTIDKVLAENEGVTDPAKVEAIEAIAASHPRYSWAWINPSWLTDEQRAHCWFCQEEVPLAR